MRHSLSLCVLPNKQVKAPDWSVRKPPYLPTIPGFPPLAACALFFPMSVFTPIPADESLLASGRLAERVGARLPDWGAVSWVDATTSTNADMQQQLRAAGRDELGPKLIGCFHQTAGRGRAGRAWQTRRGDALLFSCGWRIPVQPGLLPPLSIVAGLLACEALTSLLPDPSQSRLNLKWPNDLLLQQGKLAGILVETVVIPPAQRTHPSQLGIIIGMGMNLHGAAQLSKTLERPVADWASTGGNADLATIAATLAQAWNKAITLFADRGFAPFHARFARWDALRDQHVNVLDQGRVLFDGYAQGVDDSGRLLVATGQELRPVTVGDVSVRTIAAQVQA